MEISSTVSAVLLLFIFAILIQFLVNRLKTILGENVMKYLPADVLSALLGLVFAVVFKIDVFIYFGLSCDIPIVSYIVSGLIISAGAPAIHELLSSVREQRKALEDSIDVSVIEEKEGGN